MRCGVNACKIRSNTVANRSVMKCEVRGIRRLEILEQRGAREGPLFVSGESICKNRQS